MKRLWLAVLCGYLGLGATLQVLPEWVITRLHGSAAAAGAAVGVAFFATALARPAAGASADVGRPRRFVVTGGALVAVGAVLSAVAPTLPLLFTGRVVMGAGEAFLFGAALAWVLSATRKADRGRISGWFGLSMWGGLAVGPLVASAVRDRFGEVAVWTAVVAFGIVSAACAAATWRSAQPAMNGHSVRWQRLVPPTAVLPGVVFGLAGYGYGAVSAALMLFLASISTHGTAWGLSVFAVAFLGVRAFGSHYVDRHGGPVVAFGSLLVATGGATLLVTTANLAGGLAGAALTGAGISLMFPATVAWSLARGDAATAGPGASVAVSSSFWDIGIAVGGLATGALITSSGYPMAWLAAAALLATGALVTAFHYRTA
nr:Transporter, putative [Kibdelosporangium sp. MJ126-NF4]CTQ90133.1 Transporter, putative [Kibdelosporangium sp. MJ126-NF4]